MNLHVVTAVEPLPRLRARITFADGLSREIDLRPALRGPAFEPLLDPENFRQMHVEFDTICWANGADIAPDTLRFWCEQGRVTSEDESEAWFRRETAERVAESSGRETNSP